MSIHVADANKDAPNTAALHPTANQLPARSRERIVHLLGARLADAIDLALQCKQAHWTCKGPHFIALHELFDAAHDEMRSAMDDIAERSAALGGQVAGTVQTASERTSLPPFPVAQSDGLQHVKTLARAMAAFTAHARAAIDVAEQSEDPATADLFTAMVRVLDKRLWMIEAHIQ